MPMVKNGNRVTNYLGFLRSVLSASNRQVKIVPNRLMKEYKISGYAYAALKELGFISVKNDVARGPQLPVWNLSEHPEETHALQLIDTVNQMQLESNERHRRILEEKELTRILGNKMVTITVNGTKLHIPVINNTITFEVDGDKIEILLT